MIDYRRLQDERDVWVANNFPDDPLGINTSMLGVIEEVGELSHHYLKEAQHIRGTTEEHQAEQKDALGDTYVYLMGIASGKSLDMEECVNALDFSVATQGIRDEVQCIYALSFAVGKLAHYLPLLQVTLSERRGIWLTRYQCSRIVHVSRLFAETRGWDYDFIVEETWARVSKRDWIADPQVGGEQIDMNQHGDGK